MNESNELRSSYTVLRLVLSFLLVTMSACSDKEGGSGSEQDALGDVLADGDDVNVDTVTDVDSDSDSDSEIDGESDVDDANDGSDVDDGGSDLSDGIDGEVIDPVSCGTAEDCDDGASCTTDLCNATTGTCEWVADDSACDDDLFCNGAEQCAPDSVFADFDGCIGGTAPTRADSVSCTTGSCDEENDRILQTTDNSACNDSNDCTADTCDLTAGCVNVASNASGACDGGSGVCGEAGDCLDCVYSDDVTPNPGCSPGLPVCAEGSCVQCAVTDDCNVGLTCESGVCVGCVTDDQCNDGVGCTEDVCNLTTATCSNAPVNATCDNGLFCDGVETCRPDSALVDAGGCLAGTAPVVDDGVACTEDRCDEASDVVVHQRVDAACDDSEICTADSCTLTGCRNTPRGIGQACGGSSGDGVCDGVGNCSVCADDAVGSPDTGCTEESPDCVSGVCGLCSVAGPNCELDCEGVPGGSAFKDSCGVCDDNPDNNCIADCIGAACAECTVDDDSACDDGNECTIDSCVDGSCVQESASLDGVACRADDQCVIDAACDAGECLILEEKACNGDCLTGACYPITGCEFEDPGVDCDDGYDFTKDETCNDSGSCILSCATENPCEQSLPVINPVTRTITCSEVTMVPQGNACPDDGVPCTLDICDGAGVCTHPDNPDCRPCSELTCDGQCHTGTCVEGVGCEWIEEGTVCDDGDATTGADQCNAVGVCAGSCPASECLRYYPVDDTSGRCVRSVPRSDLCAGDGNRCTVAICTTDGNCEQVPVGEGTRCEHPCGVGECGLSGSCELVRSTCELEGTRCFDSSCNAEETGCERSGYRDEDCASPDTYCDARLKFCTAGYCGDGVCGGNPGYSESSFGCGADCTEYCPEGRSFCKSSYSEGHPELGAWMAHMSQAYGIRSINTHQSKSISEMLDDGVRWLHLRMDYCNPGESDGPLCFCRNDNTCSQGNVRAEVILDELSEWMGAHPNNIVTLYIEEFVSDRDMRAAMQAAGLDQLTLQSRTPPGTYESFPLNTDSMLQKRETLVVFGGPYIPVSNLFVGSSHDRDPDGQVSTLTDIYAAAGPAVYNCANPKGETPAEVEGFAGLYAVQHTIGGSPAWSTASCYNQWIGNAAVQCDEYYPVNAVFVDFYNSAKRPLEWAGYESPYEDRCNGAVQGCLKDDDCDSGICGGVFICLNCENSDDCLEGEFCNSTWGSCVPKLEDGTICLTDNVCDSGNCQNLICQSCSEDSDCEAEEWCGPFGGCQAKKFKGGGCFSGNECVSDNCYVGFCAECDEQTDCTDPSEFCTLNPLPGQSSCIPTKQNGALCASPFECAGGGCFLAVCSDCDSHGDCESDEFCTLSVASASTCNPKKPIDDSCGTGVECLSGSCSLFNCVETCDEDADCDDERFCNSLGNCKLKKDIGVQCFTASECTSEACYLGFCVACDGQSDCAGDTYCSLNTLPGMSACVPQKDNGGVCAQNLECASGNCYTGICSECDEHADCGADEFCTLNPLPLEESVCKAKKENESSCATGVECLSGDCILAACVDACDTGSDCASDEWCDVAGICQPQWEIGHACVTSVECASDSCYLGFCTACNSQSDCGNGQYCTLNTIPGQSECVATKGIGSSCGQNFECRDDNCWLTVCSECDEQSDCSSSEFCTLDAVPPINSTCNAKKENGSSCGTGVECTSDQCTLFVCGECKDDGQCSANEHCNAFNNCAPDVGNDAPCLRDSVCRSDICSVGFCAECRGDVDCPSSEHCGTGGNCVADVGNNAPCLRDSVCRTGICSAGFCAECLNDGHCPSSEHCGTGGDCIADVGNNAPCLRDSVCRTGICSAGFCAECLNDGDCPSSEHCGTGGDCISDVGNNAPCTRDAVCSTGICAVPLCAECRVDGDCSSSEFCGGGGDCNAKLGNGKLCARAEVCISGNCRLGFCRP